MHHQRVTVKEAARLLNTTDHAVRQRLYRGTLQSEKDVEGRVFVLITDDLTGVHDETHDESHRESLNDSHPEKSPGGHPDEYVDGLIEELREHNRFLRDQLDKEREANRENRRLLAAALERIPELEAPQDTPVPASPESRDAAETPPEGGAKGGNAPPDSQEPSERRSWLHRFFFGP